MALVPVETAAYPTARRESDTKIAVAAFLAAPVGVTGRSTPDLAAALVQNEMINVPNRRHWNSLIPSV